MELGIREKSNREGICADDSESMHDNAVEVKNIELRGRETCNNKEPLLQKTSPLNYALQTSVIRNKHTIFPQQQITELGVTKTVR